MVGICVLDHTSAAFVRWQNSDSVVLLNDIC